MDRVRRAYISVPRDHNLDAAQLVLKRAILAKLTQNGIEPQEFHVSGLPVTKPYTFDAVREVMTRCHGALILAFARWRDNSRGEGLTLPTVWNHFEGAFAVALKKEILIITEEKVAQDGITYPGGAQLILTAPAQADAAWLEAAYAKPQIDAWIKAVRDTPDVFLSYSTKARHTAIDIGRYLRDLGVVVRDWEIHFAPGAVILDELFAASRSCLGAIMLLTKDDEIAGNEGLGAPRDNVIFETGLFMEAKGRERVLVVREEGAKIPANIQGAIYLELRDRNDIKPIHTGLSDFVQKSL